MAKDPVILALRSDGPAGPPPQPQILQDNKEQRDLATYSKERFAFTGVGFPWARILLSKVKP
jgi:hypothetical protein